MFGGLIRRDTNGNLTYAFDGVTTIPVNTGYMATLGGVIGLDYDAMADHLYSKVAEWERSLDFLFKTISRGGGEKSPAVTKQNLLIIARESLQSKTNYLCRAMPPTVTAAAASAVDSLVTRVVEKVIGKGLDLDLSGNYEEVKRQELYVSTRQLFLPCKDGSPGLGFRRAIKTAPLAWVSGLIDSGPDILQHNCSQALYHMTCALSEQEDLTTPLLTRVFQQSLLPLAGDPTLKEHIPDQWRRLEVADGEKASSFFLHNVSLAGLYRKHLGLQFKLSNAQECISLRQILNYCEEHKLTESAARLHSKSAPGSAEWLRAHPTKPALRMEDDDVKSSARLHLGVLCHDWVRGFPHCVCKTELAGMSDQQLNVHLSTCKKLGTGSLVIARHNQLNRLLTEFAVSRRLTVSTSYRALKMRSNRVVDQTIYGVLPNPAMPAFIDTSVIDALAPSTLPTYRAPLSAAPVREKHKKAKYAKDVEENGNRGEVIPFVIESQGGLGANAQNLVEKIDRIKKNAPSSLDYPKHIFLKAVSVALNTFNSQIIEQAAQNLHGSSLINSALAAGELLMDPADGFDDSDQGSDSEREEDWKAHDPDVEMKSTSLAQPNAYGIDPGPNKPRKRKPTQEPADLDASSLPKRKNLTQATPLTSLTTSPLFSPTSEFTSDLVPLSLSDSSHPMATSLPMTDPSPLSSSFSISQHPRPSYSTPSLLHTTATSDTSTHYRYPLPNPTLFLLHTTPTLDTHYPLPQDLDSPRTLKDTT